LVATQQIQDLRHREADLAIRNAAPTDPDLIARRLPERKGAFYASPSYLDALGPLHTPEDLARADFLTFGHPQDYATFVRSIGIPAPDARFWLACDNHLVQWEYCRAGLGIAVNMTCVGDLDPGVRRVPVELPPMPVPMWLVAHRGLEGSRRLRAVMDIVIEVLGDFPRTGADPGGYTGRGA
jgi:DNA-binding transcriptional LysR family regulator